MGMSSLRFAIVKSWLIPAEAGGRNKTGLWPTGSLPRSLAICAFRQCLCVCVKVGWEMGIRPLLLTIKHRVPAQLWRKKWGMEDGGTGCENGICLVAAEVCDKKSFILRN